MKRALKNDAWVDFNAKINYIYEKMFDSNKEKLLLHFSDLSLSANKQKNRKKTIENWLKENGTKKPHNFTLHKFKIYQYELNGEKLFEENAFKKWALKQFTERVDYYLEEQDKCDNPNDMKYIYFLDTDEKKLGYFEISFPNNDNIINLTSPLYKLEMTYRGTIMNYNNMIYISVRNQFDYMHYIFKNNVNVYRKELKIFGVAQCVDAPTREPKAYLALLSSTKLTKEEEKNYSHKLNFSNLLIANEFTYACRQELNFFLENFSEKIYSLERDIKQYTKNDTLSEDVYLDIVLKEYSSYIKLLEKAIYHNDYPINHKRQSILFALEDMCRHKQAKATILYLLDSETLNILDTKNSIMEMQLKLVQHNKLSLTYLFVIEDLSLISQNILSKIHYLEEHGMDIRLTTNNQSIYSKILVVEGKDFAIYKRKNEQSDNHVTKNATNIEALNYEVEELYKHAISLKDFTQKHYPLNGHWFHYSFTSKENSLEYQVVEFDITNFSIVAKFPTKTELGSLLQTEEYTLLLLKESVIKIHNINLGDPIFQVSIIGKEKNIHHRDILLFGLLSRKSLSDETIRVLLESIHKKSDQEFRLKISDHFSSILANILN